MDEAKSSVRAKPRATFRRGGLRERHVIRVPLTVLASAPSCDRPSLRSRSLESEPSVPLAFYTIRAACRALQLLHLHRRTCLATYRRRDHQITTLVGCLRIVGRDHLTDLPDRVDDRRACR